jgi:soluble lytic murein transglycosylase
VESGGSDIPDEFWHILYPLRQWPAIKAETEKYGFDPWQVVALIRNESFFDADAVSPVGAIGLMQIMPDTAPRIAESLGLPAPTQAELHDPLLNIRFGVWFLAQRVERFGGDLSAALCAYNAGEGPVLKWLEQNQVDDWDEWIEIIPYYATRHYIKKILGDLREYRRIYG